MISEINIKKEMIRFCQKLYQKGFVANHDGNISAKTWTKILATPTAQSKGDITEDMFVALNLEGKKISGSHNVFSEIDLHLACYHLRSDIGAVIHAHPPIACAFAAAGVQLQKIFIAEAIVTLGEEIPLVPQKLLSQYLPYHDVFLLQNHGVLALGSTIAQAYYRLELVEHLAKIEWYSKSIGKPEPLSKEVVSELLKKREKALFNSKQLNRGDFYTARPHPFHNQ